jgi:hypothetical protein
MGKTLCRAFVWMFDPFRVGGGAKGIVEYGKILCRAFVWMFDPFRVWRRARKELLSMGRPFAGPLYGCATPSGSGGGSTNKLVISRRNHFHLD